VKTATFKHDAYVVRDLQHAKIMAVGDVGRNGQDIYASTEERWVVETAHTLELFASKYDFPPNSYLLDYGCGGGRLAKEIVDNWGCEVVGADQSESMRSVARHYVKSKKRFHTCPPEAVGKLEGRFDFAWCVWVLQHSADPATDIRRIHAALKPGARFLVINELVRFIPTYEYGFIDDGVNIRSLLEEVFGDPIETGMLDPRCVSQEFSDRTYWAVFQK
jgi:SAM-dependent methyltransferase